MLSVAIIQAILAGMGFLAADVPAAGLWSLLVLLVAVVQIPTFLILGPIVIYSICKTWSSGPVEDPVHRGSEFSGYAIPEMRTMK